MNTKKKRLIVFVSAFVLVFSIYFIVNSFAKYKSDVVINGETSIAKWELLVNDNGLSDIDLSIGGDATTYTLRITNKSDVASKYSIYFSDLPDNVLIAIDDGEYKTSADGKIEFIDFGQFNLDDENNVHEYTIYFKASSSALEVSDKEIGLDITFTQIGLE